jgi:hypothetical protein
MVHYKHNKTKTNMKNKNTFINGSYMGQEAWMLRDIIVYKVKAKKYCMFYHTNGQLIEKHYSGAKAARKAAQIALHKRFPNLKRSTYKTKQRNPWINLLMPKMA